MGSLGTEARVGIFVLGALALLAVFILALGDFRLAKGFTLFADFAYAGDLQTGAPVKVSGVRVGRVRTVRLLRADASPPPAPAKAALGQSEAPLVRAELALDDQVRSVLGEGTQVAAGMQGLVGETYLELTPGKGPPLAEAAAVRGVDAPDLHRLTLEVAALVDALGAFAPTEGGTAGQGLAALLGTVNGILGERREVLSQALADLAASAGDLRAVLAQTRAALGDRGLVTLVADAGASAASLRRELPPLLASARQSLDRLSTLTAAAERATAGGAIDDVVRDLRQSAQTLAQLTAGARTLLGRVERGEGTVGGLLNDPQIYDDAKEMLRDLKRHPWKLLWRD